ncbi:MAG: sugar phosphate isomerase/epimerase [Clostridia bacterium]|nr:sugar phosphate isomerase/epimerase [Clostridia bacterium]
MWTLGITQWSLPGNHGYTLQLAKQLGFDAVQLEFGSWEAGMALSHKRLRALYRHDSEALGIRLLPLTINALCRYGIVDGLDTPDGQIAKDTILAALEAAADMGLEGVTLPSFGAGEIKTQAHYEHTVEALRFTCEKAAALGLTVYTENVLDAQAMERLFRDCGSDCLRLLFDSQNYSVFGHDDAVDVLKTHWNRLGNHLHVKDGGDMGTMLLGTGSSPFAQVMETLRERGYAGTIVLENNYGSLPLCQQAKDCFSLVQQDMKTVCMAMK